MQIINILYKKELVLDMKFIHEGLFWLKVVLFTYVISMILLGILALITYKVDCSETVVKAGIIVIYFVSALAGGLVSGKTKKSRRLIYGLCSGAIYAVILMCISILVKSDAQIGVEFTVALITSLAGGTAGGVLS